MIRKIPLFYFPPSICWIDDDPLFLEAAKQLFQMEYNCLSFVDPQQAVSYLDTYQAPSSQFNFTREFTESDIFDVQNHLPIDLNISEITNLHRLPDIKNKEIGLLIIDNNMPHITGLEICKKLANTPYKKILLTGETGLTDVVNAFNQGIIDKFISKDKNVSENLNRAINELSHQYFYEQSKSLINYIESSRQSPLSDPIFTSFFFNWLESNSYQEFYLVNKSGSFLIKKKDGSLAYFIVFTEHAKNEFLKLNEDAVNKTGDLLSQLSQGQAVPFFGLGKESWDFNHGCWNKYFFSSNTLSGRQNYYWTVINDGDIQ